MALACAQAKEKMARVVTAQEKIYHRTGGQSSRLYLGVLQPATVFSARVNGAPADDDMVAALTFDGGSGVGGDAGQLVYVGTTAGAYDKGMVRLRSDVSGATGSMEIGEISEITWADNDHLTVVDEMALAARHLRILPDKTVLMDYDIAYTDQHAYPATIPVFGPSLVPTWLTGSTVRVQFDAGDSWTLDGGALTYAWVFPGSSANGGLTGATTWADYNAAGTYRVKCTVTRDYGGGNVVATSGYRYVLIYTTAAPPVTEFSLDQCAGSWGDRGWTWKVTLHGDDAAIGTIRDRAWVVLFARDFYGATEISMGPIPDRENIVTQGWIAGETIKVDKEQGAVTFEVRHPMWWLLQMRGFPTGLEDVQVAPTAWTQMEDLTLRKGLWEFVFWRTTLPAILDVQLTDDATGISIFNASPGTLGAQIISEANNTIRAYPCCDRFGRLFVEKEPQLIPESARGGIPILQAVELQDLRRPFSLTRTVVNKVGQVDLTGMFYDGDHQPFFSLSPGHVFNWLGANIERADQLALASQAQANELAGLFIGWRNIRYPDVPLPMASNYRMADVTPHQYMTLALDAGDTLRDIALALTLVLRSITFRYDAATGQLLTDIKGEQTSAAERNMNGDIPPDPPPVPDPEYPPPDWPPLPDLEAGWPTIAFIAGLDKGVYRGLGDFDPANSNQPTWAAINDSLPTLDVTHFGINAGLTGDKQQVCRLETDGQIYTRDTDVSVNWGVSLSNATVQGDLSATALITSMGVDVTTGRIWVYVFDEFGGPGGYMHWFYYSDNWGVSWGGPNAQDDSAEFDDYLRGAGMVGGFGSICWASNWTHLYATFMWYGPSNGAGPWLMSDQLWFTGFAPPVFVHPASDGLKAYSNKTAKYITEFEISGGTGLPINQLETDGLWNYATDETDERWNSMWGSWSDVNVMRCLTRFGGTGWYRIAETDDNWSTYSFSARLDSILGTAAMTCMAPVVQEADEDMMAFACAALGVPSTPTYHAVYTMYGLAGTPVGKAGNSPESSPYTDSIPYDLGQIAQNGLQFVRGS